MYKISKEFKFEAAHRLWQLDDDHACKKLHGHSYKVEVELGADHLDENGFIIDFGELKPFQEYLDLAWDHRTILTYDDPLTQQLADYEIMIMPDKLPSTAENMARVFADIVAKLFAKKIDGMLEIKVTVWETAKNSASFQRFA